MVAEEAADLVQTCTHRQPTDGHAHLAVVVAEIAVVCARAQVDPFADVRMAQETVVAFVAVTVHDARLDLAADAALRAKRRARADLRAKHLRHRPDIARPFQPREGMDHRFIVDDHRAPRRIGHHHRLDARGPSDPEPVCRPDHRYRRGSRRKATHSQCREIGGNRVTVVLDQVPGVFEHRSVRRPARKLVLPRVEHRAGVLGRQPAQLGRRQDRVGHLAASALARWQPAPVNEHGRLRAQPGQIIDRNRWTAVSAQQLERGANHEAAFRRAERAGLLVGKRSHAAQQIENGPRKREREQILGTVLEQAQVHDRNPLNARNGRIPR